MTAKAKGKKVVAWTATAEDWFMPMKKKENNRRLIYGFFPSAVAEACDAAEWKCEHNYVD